jgi:ACS family glucarate transporter-like MFS transporter
VTNISRVRYLLVAVTFTLTTLLYVDRIAISAAKQPLTDEFQLSDTQFGWVLSAFALGYALFQAPAGALADKLGARLVLAVIVTLWSVFTGLTGLAWGFVSLLVFRFLFGLAEAGAFPTCARVIYAWLPASERGLAQGINLSGSRIGAAFTLPIIAWLLTAVGWRHSFMLLGVAGLVWAAAWYAWFRNSPEEHSSMSEAEIHFIAARRGDAQGAAVQMPPAGLLWRSQNLWLIMGQYFASNFTFFFCLTWLFPHLQRTYALDAVQTGLLSAIPLLGGACGNWVGGAVADALYRRGWARNSRRYTAMFGFSLAAWGLAGSLFADSAIVAVAWLILAVFGSDMTTPASWAFCIDIGGKFSGSVSGLMNMAGNLGSFSTSLAFPYLFTAFGSTRPFFIIGVVLNVLAVVFWWRTRPERGLGNGGDAREHPVMNDAVGSLTPGPK